MGHRVSIVGVCLALAAGVAEANYFDGKQQLLCTAFQIFQCDSIDGCQSVAVDDVGASRHYLLDFKKKLITTSRENPLQSRIDNQEIHDNTLFVQGIEDGQANVRDGAAWAFSINQPDGQMVLSVSAGDAGFVALGGCTPYDG
jgi:hypothetical protein